MFCVREGGRGIRKTFSGLTQLISFHIDLLNNRLMQPDLHCASASRVSWNTRPVARLPGGRGKEQERKLECKAAQLWSAQRSLSYSCAKNLPPPPIPFPGPSLQLLSGPRSHARALHCGCTVCLHFHPRFQRLREGRLGRQGGGHLQNPLTLRNSKCKCIAFPPSVCGMHVTGRKKCDAF